MTELSYNCNVFKFYDEFINLSDTCVFYQTSSLNIDSSLSEHENRINIELPYYETKIIVKEMINESNIEYYDITYEFNFIKSNLLSNELNKQIKISSYPFINNYFINNNNNNSIVKKNSLTKQLINYLLMDYKYLQIEAGLTTAQQYKNNVMYSLHLLNISNYNETITEFNYEFNITVQNEIKEFYDISYKINKNDYPFNKFKTLVDFNDNGVIVKTNSLTTKLIKYLNMNYSDLKKYSDIFSPQEYKIRLFVSLCLFWD